MLALRGAQIFDGTRMLERPVVLVEGAKVVAAGAQPPADVEVIDLGDATLLPGLIDCHQHLCFDGSGPLEEQVAGVDDTALTVRARLAAERAMAGGVTTLRDLGDRGWVTLGLRHDDRLPTILAAGPPITRDNGHCWYLGGGCSDETSLRRAVRDRVEHGCDVVKIMATGGALTPSFPMWEPQFSEAELRIVVDEAHREGLPVASHCHGIDGIRWSLNAGVDSIEHCTFMTADGRSEPDEALMERLGSSGVAVSATLGRKPEVPLPPIIAANMETLSDARRRLHELGATLVAGTDAGISEAKPHDVLPHALVDFIASGMTALEGLQALTSVAAKVCGAGHSKGRLAAGFDADILAVRGDPTRDPSCLPSVLGVWKGGQRVH
jgi:imidazolonepropionase-like amidohydrolase